MGRPKKCSSDQLFSTCFDPDQNIFYLTLVTLEENDDDGVDKLTVIWRLRVIGNSHRHKIYKSFLCPNELDIWIFIPNKSCRT